MIIGMNFNSVSAKAEEKKLGAKGITVNSSPKIVSVEKAEILDMKDVVRVDFNFTSKYEPEVGEISIDGSLLWRGEAKKILKMWEDEKKLEPVAGLDILNTIFRKCLARSVMLAEDVRLPPPIQFPYVVKGEKGEKAA